MSILNAYKKLNYKYDISKKIYIENNSKNKRI